MHVSKISLPSDFCTFFHDFIHVHTPGRGRQPTGPNFWCQQENLITWLFVASFKKISSTSDFIHIFSWFNKMYIAVGQGQTTPRGQNFDVNRNLLSLRSFGTSFKKSPWNLMLFIFFTILYMYIAPGQTTHWEQNFDVNINTLSLSHLLQVSKNIFEIWFYT